MDVSPAATLRSKINKILNKLIYLSHIQVGAFLWQDPSDKFLKPTSLLFYCPDIYKVLPLSAWPKITFQQAHILITGQRRKRLWYTRKLCLYYLYINNVTTFVCNVNWEMLAWFWKPCPQLKIGTSFTLQEEQRMNTGTHSRTCQIVQLYIFSSEIILTEINGHIHESKSNVPFSTFLLWHLWAKMDSFGVFSLLEMFS